MNKVMLIGRTTQDISLIFTQSGKAVAKVTLAVDRSYKNESGQRETDFINLVIWNKLAEIVAQYVKKGKLIAVEGELQIRQYEKNNERRYISEVVCSDVQFLERMTEIK